VSKNQKQIERNNKPIKRLKGHGIESTTLKWPIELCRYQNEYSLERELHFYRTQLIVAYVNI